MTNQHFVSSLMRHRRPVALILVFLTGCQTLANRPEPTPALEPGQLPAWSWSSALPSGMQRAELLPAVIDRATLTRMASRNNQSPTVLASASSDSADLRIISVAGRPVRTLNDLVAAARQATTRDRAATMEVSEWNATPTGREVTAAEATVSAANSGATAIQITHADLRAIELNAAQRYQAIRFIEDGNPWALITDGHIRCALTVRVERGARLLQVILNVSVIDGPPARLPINIHARCHDEPLHCLSVPETLERLYGSRDHKPDSPEPNRSFAAVSQRDDYQIPTNFKRLEEATKRFVGMPAFAITPGARYPGSPVLGDARALSAFVLQPQFCHANDPERIGWVIFAGERLEDGEMIEVAIDLGSGPIPVPFTLPRP